METSGKEQSNEILLSKQTTNEKKAMKNRKENTSNNIQNKKYMCTLTFEFECLPKKERMIFIIFFSVSNGFVQI